MNIWIFWSYFFGETFSQQIFCPKSSLTAPSNVLPLHFKPTFPPLKVMGSNLGYLLKSYLVYQFIHLIVRYLQILTGLCTNLFMYELYWYECLRISFLVQISNCNLKRTLMVGTAALRAFDSALWHLMEVVCKTAINESCFYFLKWRIGK